MILEQTQKKDIAFYVIYHTHEYGNSCFLVKSDGVPSEQDAIDFINEHGGGYDEHLGENIDVFGPYLADKVIYVKHEEVL